MADDLILYESAGEGAVALTFNRPAKLNALSSPMIEQLDAALDRLAGDPAARAAVLRGAGDRAFVAGADIAEYQGNKAAQFIAYQQRSREVFGKLAQLPKPTVAAVRGYALGGGFEIALCCDIIICSADAQFGLPEGRLGLSPGGGGTQRLTRAIGKHAASDAMLAGWRLSGQRAYQLGLAAACVDAGELDAAVSQRVRALLKVAPLAQAAMKRLMREGCDAALPAALSLEQEELFRLYGTADGQEGIDAFLEKRDPQFKGE